MLFGNGLWHKLRPNCEQLHLVHGAQLTAPPVFCCFFATHESPRVFPINLLASEERIIQIRINLKTLSFPPNHPSFAAKGEPKMELASIETTFVENAVREADRDQLRELNDLQLAVVGGGGGDVVFA